MTLARQTETTIDLTRSDRLVLDKTFAELDQMVATFEARKGELLREAYEAICEAHGLPMPATCEPIRQGDPKKGPITGLRHRFTGATGPTSVAAPATVAGKLGEPAGGVGDGDLSEVLKALQARKNGTPKP